MTFLNPLVLLGLIAASIPVLIHLLNLKKLKRIDFSTLAFLKELQKNKIRKIKLKQWLLLAMRVMIIIFLVLAFARPALRGTTIGGAASSAKTTAVYIIDDTFSMSVIGSKGSYLNQAKENVKHLLSELQEGDDAAVILLSKADEEIKITSNLSDLIKQTDNIRISSESGTIHEAVIKAADIISGSRNYNKEIYIFSDFQENRIFSGSLSDLSELLNENVKLYTFNFSDKPVYNLAVTEFKLQSQILEKNKPIIFDVTVSNFSDRDADDVVLSLFTNGERSSQKSFDVKAGGSLTLPVEATLKSSGFLEFYSEIEDDEIISDNKRYFTIFIPSEINVGFFTQSENDTRYIELALSITGKDNPIKITKQNINQLSSRNLSSFSAIVVTGAPLERDADRLKSFIEDGGGLLLFPSSAVTRPESYNHFLSSMNIPSFSGITGRINDKTNSRRFSKVDTDHPLFQNLFINNKKRIESPDIYLNYGMSPAGKGQDIISLSDGTSFLSEFTSGKGKLIIFASSPDPSWSTFPLKSIFAPLLYKSILYLSHNQVDYGENFAGTPLRIDLKGKSVPQLYIKKPDEGSETINPADENYILFKNSETAGIYTVSNDEVIDKIAVNTDPAESSVKYLSDDGFKNYLNQINFRGRFINIDVSADAGEEIVQARFGSELWKFFAVLTLLLAIAEMTVARSLKRDLAIVK